MPTRPDYFDQARKSVRRKLRDKLSYKRRTKEVKCTLTRQDYAHLLRHAAGAGMRPATYLKRAAMAYMGQQYLVPDQLEQTMLKLIYELSAIGNNLNQIARKANFFQKVTVFDLREAKRLTSQLEEAVKTFITRPTTR
ncbi:MobC family plasmid mobilization relaxosome protein [Candidatus Woesearchaeota archaeon]|nr:MobC family plasmid mobilization relaxosome protein [Candidatus Woesearchaeota archaeon]